MLVQAEVAELRADKARMVEELAAAKATAATDRAKADRLIAQIEADLAAAHARTDEMMAEVEALRQKEDELRRADLDRRGQRRWARLMAAWRGK